MKAINSIILAFMAAAAFSCEDIVEEDITDKTIEAISPVSGQEIESNVVTFQWKSLKGADDYRIQVYGENQAMMLDSLVNRTAFTFPLPQGEYQWRVRGENFGYQSSYSLPMQFSVIETDDLTQQQVILSSPTDGIYTNSSSLTCNWQAISAAENYEIQLINVSNGQSIAYQQADLTATTFALPTSAIATDAEYQWKIRAINSNGQTPFASRNFFIDRVNPNQPQNSLPIANSTQLPNLDISFSWTSPADNGTIHAPLRYVIEFANDVNFSTVLQSSNVSGTSFQQSFTNPGNYFWRIKTLDQAGNSSAYSLPFKFVIN